MDRWRPSGLLPWRPFRGLDDVERYMDEMMSNWPFRMLRRVPAEEMLWTPAVEVYEKDDRFVVRAEVPGVTQDDISVSMNGDTLTIKGERRASEEVKDEEYHRCEVCYGAFTRSITLPSPVDVDKIDAAYEDGVLKVMLPKAKAARPARIPIKVVGEAKALKPPKARKASTAK